MLPVTAHRVVELIQESIGVAAPDDTVDTFKSGNPDAVVGGIAVTMMPTLEVLKLAVAQGCNMVIAHEPMYYGHRDETAALQQENDAVWLAKRDFIADNDLILWRFHDLPHLQNPDAITAGIVEELGWEIFQNPDNDHCFDLPATTVENLARELRAKLGIKTLRVVGNAAMEARKIAFTPGCPGFEHQRHLWQETNADILVIGEAFEWETIAYAADAAAAGLGKALIILGHIPSEQGGMKNWTRWLQKLLPTTPISYIPTSEPFWTPALGD